MRQLLAVSSSVTPAHPGLALGDSFEEHLEAVVTLLLPILKEDADPDRCEVAVNVVRRICGAIGEKTTAQAETLLPILISTASHESTSASVVACILSAFVDVVTAVGPTCDQHLEGMLRLLDDTAGRRSKNVSKVPLRSNPTLILMTARREHHVGV